MPNDAFDYQMIRFLTPAGSAVNKRIGAACGPLQGATPDHALHVLQAHCFGLVLAAVAMSPEDPVRWRARIDAALLVVRDLARTLEAEGGAPFLDALLDDPTTRGPEPDVH